MGRGGKKIEIIGGTLYTENSTLSRVGGDMEQGYRVKIR